MSLLLRIYGASLADIKPTADIWWDGDSLTENQTPDQWNTQIKSALTASGDSRPRKIGQRGLGGQTGAQILGRQGGRPVLVTFPHNSIGIPEISASGTTSVAVNIGLLNHPGSGNVEEQSINGTFQTRGGIYGTLSRLAGSINYVVTTAAGTAIMVPPKVAFVPDRVAERHCLGICWIGTNNLIAGDSADAIFADIVDYVERGQLTATKRCVIVMPHWNFASTNRRATYEALWQLVSGRYGAWAIETIGELAAYHDGSSNDLADIVAGFIPRSLLGGDRLHFPAAGTAYLVITTRIAQVIVNRGA